MTVKELLSRADSAELSEWMAYDSIEPFGQQRADTGHAMVACVLANINRAKGKSPYKVEDFMPFKEPEPIQEQTVETQKEQARKIAAVFGLTLKE